jgi:hypothetical protein
MLPLKPWQMAQTRNHAAKHAVDLGCRRAIFIAARRAERGEATACPFARGNGAKL